MRSTAFAALSLLAACSGSRPISSEVSPAAEQHTEMRTEGGPAAESPRPVLAEIQFRDHILVVRAGTGDLRYDVKARAGQLLAAALTWRDLGEKFPAIAEQFSDSTALPLDASITPAARGEAAGAAASGGALPLR